MKIQGNLFVIAAPSGTGKTSLVKAVVDKTENVLISISYTTRAMRPGEENGINYHFVDKPSFIQMIEDGEFLEYANVFHHFYGTAHKTVKETLAKGIDVILEIDWQGCQQIRAKFPNSTSIFILPPSQKELQKRLEKRNQDKPEVIKERVADAKETSTHINEFDYVILNDDFSRAEEELKNILLTARLKKSQQLIKYAKLLKDLKK